MAVYEFVCPKCNKEFELTRPISKADEPASCPKCGAIGKRLVSVFSSGSGFSIKGPNKDAFRGKETKTQTRSVRKGANRRKKA